MVSLLKLAKVTEDGVEFQSPHDGTMMLLTPEKSIEIQNAIGNTKNYIHTNYKKFHSPTVYSVFKIYNNCTTTPILLTGISLEIGYVLWFNRNLQSEFWPREMEWLQT